MNTMRWVLLGVLSLATRVFAAEIPTRQLEEIGLATDRLTLVGVTSDRVLLASNELGGDGRYWRTVHSLDCSSHRCQARSLPLMAESDALVVMDDTGTRVAAVSALGYTWSIGDLKTLIVSAGTLAARDGEAYRLELPPNLLSDGRVSMIADRFADDRSYMYPVHLVRSASGEFSAVAVPDMDVWSMRSGRIRAAVQSSPGVLTAVTESTTGSRLLMAGEKSVQYGPALGGKVTGFAASDQNVLLVVHQPKRGEKVLLCGRMSGMTEIAAFDEDIGVNVALSRNGSTGIISVVDPGRSSMSIARSRHCQLPAPVQGATALPTGPVRVSADGEVIAHLSADGIRVLH